MALSLEDIKNIDQETTDIVYGYIRESQKLFSTKHDSFYIISDLIISSILLFYRTTEYFCKAGEGITISGNNKNIITKTGNQHSWSNTSYCFNWIESKSNKIITWTFKLDKLITVAIDSSVVTFGIVTNDNHWDDDFSFIPDHHNYLITIVSVFGLMVNILVIILHFNMVKVLKKEMYYQSHWI